MPAFLNILTKSATIAAFAIIASAATYAQCSLTKTEKNGVVTLQTKQNYQYVKAGGTYNAVGIILRANRIGTDVNYTVLFQYTGNRLWPNPSSLFFAMANNQKPETKLKLVKVQKTDNAKLSIRYYEAALTPAVIELLEQSPLTNLEFAFSARAPVSIKVNDPAIIQNQIVCLQSGLK